MTLLALALLPALGGCSLLLMPRDRPQVSRAIAVSTATAALALSTLILIAMRLNPGGETYGFIVRLDWIPSLGAELFLGVDGLRALLLFVTTLLGLGAALAVRGRGAAGSLLLQASLTAALVSLDLLLIAIFWTISLLVSGLLLSRRDGSEPVSARRFTASTLVAASVLVAGVALVGARAGTFDLGVLGAGETFRDAPGLGRVAFVLLLLGFAAPMLIPPRLGAASGAEPFRAPEVLVVGVLTRVGALGAVTIALTVAPRAAADLALLPTVAGGAGLVLAGVLAVRTVDPGRLVALSGVALSGLVLLAAGALAAGAGEGALLGVLAALVVHGLFAGLVCLTRIPESPLDDAMPGLPGIVGCFGLALLPGFAALGGDPSFLPEALRVHPLETVAATIGFGLPAFALSRAGLAAFRADRETGVRGVGATVLLGVIAATALLFGLAPRILSPLLRDAAERVVHAISTGGMP